MLLTAANLAQIHQQYQQSESGGDRLSTRDQNIQYYLRQSTNQQDPIGIVPVTIGEKKAVEPDNVSIASSMHFTVVNVSTSRKPPQRSFCRKHQLTILVVTMSALFTIGIMTAILLLESKFLTQDDFTKDMSFQTKCQSTQNWQIFIWSSCIISYKSY